MIVDDELLSRIGIKSIIDWNAHGYEIIAECENGQKAFEAAKIQQPDIIITDIRMPVANGIELINLIKSENLNIKFVVLSAYNDFEYVREAMRLGAEDYLLKLEMDGEKLLNILERIKFKLAHEENNKINQTNKDTMYHHNLSEMRQLFFVNCFNGIYSEQEIQTKWSNVCGDITLENLMCVLVKTVQPPTISPQMHGSIVDTIRKIANEYGNALIVKYAGDYIVVISLKDIDRTYIKRMMEDIKYILKNMLNITVHTYKSGLLDNMGQLYQAYVSIRESIDNMGVSVDTIPFEEFLQRLEIALNNYHIPEVNDIFNQIQKLLKDSSGFRHDNLDSMCHTVIFLIKVFAKHNSIDENLFFNHINPYEQVKTMRTVEHCAEWVKHLNETFNKVVNYQNDNTRIVINAKRFISNSLRDNLTLELVAQQVNLSPSHFGRVFCKQTGQTLFTYINRCRIEAAKKLLQTSDYKIYEISEIVGYTSTHYFSRTFKKYTGKSPNDYKAK